MGGERKLRRDMAAKAQIASSPVAPPVAGSRTHALASRTVVTCPPVTFPPETKLEMDSTNLLLQGVGKRDGYQALPETLRQMEGRLTRIAERLEWKDAETKALADLIWEKIAGEPKPLNDLWIKTHSSAMTFLEVVMEMGMNGQAELFVEEAKFKEK